MPNQMTDSVCGRRLRLWIAVKDWFFDRAGACTYNLICSHKCQSVNYMLGQEANQWILCWVILCVIWFISQSLLMCVRTVQIVYIESDA